MARAHPDKPIIGPNSYICVPETRLRLDRSAIFQTLLDWYPTRYPQVQAVGWWDEQSDAAAVWFTGFGAVDIGFYHVSESETFTEELRNGYFPVGPITAPDVAAPGAITDLAEEGGRLAWTAPGDDGSSGGRAAAYSVRCVAGIKLDAPSWSRPEAVEQSAPAPAAAGTIQSLPLDDPGPGPRACAITATDDVNQTSRLSNVVAIP